MRESKRQQTFTVTTSNAVVKYNAWIVCACYRHDVIVNVVSRKTRSSWQQTIQLMFYFQFKDSGTKLLEIIAIARRQDCLERALSLYCENISTRLFSRHLVGPHHPQIEHTLQYVFPAAYDYLVLTAGSYLPRVASPLCKWSYSRLFTSTNCTTSFHNKGLSFLLF